MDSDEEQQIYGQLTELRDEIRNRVCMVGPSARWHISKASKMLEDPEWAKIVVDEGIDEEELHSHLQSLPRVIEELKKQDARCAEAWSACRLDPDQSAYERERTRIIAVFDQVRLRSSAYVRLVRQAEKPLVRDAKKLLGERDPSDAEISRVENVARMNLNEYVRNETMIEDCLRSLDAARDQIVQHHQAWATELAHATYPDSVTARDGAIRGLQLSTNYYDNRRGYAFREYARHWIVEHMNRAMNTTTPGS